MALTREEAEAYAESISTASIDGDDGFFPRLAARRARLEQPARSVRICYESLRVVDAARTAASALPSVPNVLKALCQKALCIRPESQELMILNDITGCIEPGRLTVLLGPPSCGKTTFLRAIAGRLPTHAYKGCVTYNGVDVADFCPQRTAAFVPQSDVHVPNLTAHETAAFSCTLQTSTDEQIAPFSGDAAPDAAQLSSGSVKLSAAATPTVDVDGLSPKKALADLSDEDLARLAAMMLDGDGLVDTIMQFFGLLTCKDTWVGSQMIRGISGGERKRLSTVEMLMGRQRVLVMDEISTGLDAATLFQVIRWLRTMTQHLGLTVVTSLLQPPPETFALFDDVILMNHGTVVYHGPVADAVESMTQLGFALPDRKDVPSFLQEVTTVKGQLTYATPALRAQHRVPPDLDAADDVEVAGMELLIPLPEMAASLAKIVQRPAPAAGLDATGGPGDGAIVDAKHPYAKGPRKMLRQVLARQVKLFLRDKTLARARIAQCLIMGLLIGGLWYGLDTTLEDSRTFMSAAFMAVMFMGFGGMPQLAVALHNRRVWFKQRNMHMYTAASYAWSMGLVQVPLAVIETMIFSVLIYFMIGFSTDSAQYFFLFALTLMTASISITSVFRLIGSTFHSPAIAQAVGGFILLMLIVNSGFVIVRSAIPPWTVYFYWLSPFAYSVRAIVINEFTSERWDPIAPGTDQRMGDVALEAYDFHTDRFWIPIGIAFNFLFFIVCTALSALALWVLNPPKQPTVFRDKAMLQASIKAARQAREEAEAMLKGSAAQGPAGQAAPGDAQRPSSRHIGSAHKLSVGSTLKFQPITLVWRDVRYYVTVPKGLTGAAALNIMPEDAESDVAGKKRLLDGITGYAEPGVLTALMGGSGAGKTTLMDVLAGRKTQGVIHGDLLVNGHAKVQETWARVVGYVEQTDIHSGGLTVEESLAFSAGLRLDTDISANTRAAYVLEVLLVTELLAIRGNLVGEAGVSGLSVEQRRRLSIGVELVANPSVVFMDEPTSGLDARSASAVMSAVANVASNGRTVMVTIHQPSIEIFEAFDRLVLLGMGGKLIYNGPVGVDSRDLIEYFESVDGVQRIEAGYNPATWMLEVSGGGAKMHVDAAQADFPTVYRESNGARATAQRADALVKRDAATHAPLTLASRYAVPFRRQAAMVTWKQFVVYWRFPSYTVARLVITVVTAVIFGLTWWQEGELPSGDIADVAHVQTILGALYAGLSFMGMMNLLAGLPAFFSEREVMYRERAASMYAVTPFAIASGVVEVPYLVVQVVVFVPIMYFMVGFKVAAEPFFLFTIVFFQSIALYTFMGQFFAYLAPTVPIATLLGGLLHFLWNIFNGFLVPNPAMAKGWLWLNYISATTWVIYALAASQLGNETQQIVAPGYPGCTASSIAACPTVSQYLDDFFGYDYDFRWACVGILVGFIVVFRVGAMISLKLINHQRR